LFLASSPATDGDNPCLSQTCLSAKN
jgi:hypothetical protein